MKRIKLIPGLLAGAMVLTSVSAPLPVRAASVDLEEGLVARYTFDEESLADSLGGTPAAAVVTKLGAYEGDVAYADDRDGGKAVRLGDYGLELNRENLGENFTVSLWIKPDGAFLKDQSGVFLGYHNPEKWLAVAGNEDGTARFWANGNGYQWTGLGNTAISSDSWHQLTLVGSADGVSAYLDGVRWGHDDKTNSPLVGENQDIYVGVTYWDAEYNGLADDVRVYDRTLSAAEIYRLYDSETEASALLEQTGVTVSPEALSMVLDRTQQLTVSMHPVVEAAAPAITFESSNPEVATVTDDGTVTAVGAGEATITAAVTLDNVTKTAEATVRVTSGLEDHLVASFDFEESLSNGVSENESATMLGRNLAAYDGAAVYAEGRDGGKAVQLGDYGLQLNTKDIGSDYTVSFWVKNDEVLEANQVLLLLGYHDPENWLALSGNKNMTTNVKFWGNGGGFGWTTLATTSVPVAAWHQITITGTDGQVALYRDGVQICTAASNNPLSGANADIYLGVNNWDALFQGLVDEVRVYDVSMTREEVQKQAQELFQESFAKQAEAALDVSDLLGSNRSADDIRYDLDLPAQADGLGVTWSSSDPSVIDSNGTVSSPAEATEVTLTANFTDGLLSHEKTFTVTVSALDRAELNRLLDEAKAVDTAYLTDISSQRLAQAIAQAEKAGNTFDAVEEAQAVLELALSNLHHTEEAVDPFAIIPEPEQQVALQADETQTLFTVPEALQDLVTVTYRSADEAVARYEDGAVTAVGEGKTIVTATVTAGYDGFAVEYATAVSVTGSGSTGGGGSTVSRYTITVTQTEGGKISPSTTSVTRGSDKTFTITANEGYAISDVLVDGKSVGAVSTYIFEDVKATHTIMAKFTKDIDDGDTPLGNLPYTDVKSGDWFAEAVQYVTDNKLMGGVSETEFAPNSATTRAMFVTILARMEGVDTSAGSTWYEAGQKWAMEEGISDGSNMEGTMTREQLATMLYRYAGSPAASGEITGFADASSVSDWASDAMKWAVSEGIVGGSDGKLNPQDSATRAQVAAMLMRFCEMI